VLPTGFFAFAILVPNRFIDPELAGNHCQKGTRRPLTRRQRLARIPQSAQQNSKAKAIGIATALFNHRQVLFAKCVKTDQLGFLDREGQ
jgi:hypothetical protein